MLRIRILCGAECTWSGEFDQDEVVIGEEDTAHVPVPPVGSGGTQAPIRAKVIRQRKQPDVWALRIEEPGGADLRIAGAISAAGAGAHVPVEREVDLVVSPGQLTIRIETGPAGLRVPGRRARRFLPAAAAAATRRLPEAVSFARRRPGFVGLLAVLLTAVVIFLLEQHRRVQQRIVALEAKPHPSTPSRDVPGPPPLDAAKGSTYLVALKNAAGDITGVATAWAVSENQLVTNAHVVAAQKHQDEGGDQLIVRHTGDRPLDFPVRSVLLHPGFERWQKVFERPLLRMGAAGFEPLQLIPVADVALLRVEGKLTPLPLARDRDLHRLDAGSPVGYVGYPAENLPGTQINAPPTAVQGRLTGMTDGFFREVGPRDSVLLQHDLPMTGGASGSPLLDSHGAVVGLVSASGFVQTMGGRAPVGLGFALRADLVRELVDGTALASQAARDAEWFGALESLTGTPRQRIVLSARLQLRNRAVAGTGDPSAALDEISEFRAPLFQGEAHASEHRLQIGPGKFAFVGASDDWSDVDLTLGAAGRLLGEDRLADGLPAVWVTLDSAQEVLIRVFAGATNLPHLPPHATVIAFRVLETTE